MIDIHPRLVYQSYSYKNQNAFELEQKQFVKNHLNNIATECIKTKLQLKEVEICITIKYARQAENPAVD